MIENGNLMKLLEINDIFKGNYRNQTLLLVEYIGRIQYYHQSSFFSNRLRKIVKQCFPCTRFGFEVSYNKEFLNKLVPKQLSVHIGIIRRPSEDNRYQI
jgi:hypothetical protein